MRSILIPLSLTLALAATQAIARPAAPDAPRFATSLLLLAVDESSTEQRDARPDQAATPATPAQPGSADEPASPAKPATPGEERTPGNGRDQAPASRS